MRRTQTSKSATSSISVTSTIPSLTAATRKRYSPRGVSPEILAPSPAASKTLEWHPHSNNGCVAVPPVMAASRAGSVMRSTLHCSCGQVRQSALSWSVIDRRNNTPLISTRRLGIAPVAGVMASAVNVTGSHGIFTASSGIRTGRVRGKYRGRASTNWAHARRWRPASVSPIARNARRNICIPADGACQRDVTFCAVRGAATTSIRVGCEPAGNWMRPFSFLVATSNAMSSSLLGQLT